MFLILSYWSINKTKCTPCPTYNYPSGNLIPYYFYQGHCYMITTQKYTWSNARTQCSNNDGYLWIVNDPTEYVDIHNLYMTFRLNDTNTHPTVWV